MNSWWTTWKVVLVTICSGAVVTVVGRQINEALQNAANQKTRRLATHEDELTQREHEKTEQARYAAEAKKHEADKVRWESELASTKAACDECINFTSAQEAAEAQKEVG